MARTPEYARTRYEAVERLAILVAGTLDEGRRVLVGFDFPFGYPAGVAGRLTGRASGLELWRWLTHRIEDAKDNANNRYEVAAKINRRYPGTGPFWGRPRQWNSLTDIPIRARERTRRERHPPERRIAGSPDRRPSCQRGQDRMAVGLCRFRLRKKIRARKGRDEILDRAQVRVAAEAFARLDARDGLVPLFSGAPGLSGGERHLVEAEEAWILGLGHEDALARAAG